MLKKTPTRSGRACRVTFTLPTEVEAKKAHLCGDFNGWERPGRPMIRRKDGRFSTTLTLKTGREYRFRYLLDGERWENDWVADNYLPNPFGGEDSVLKL